MKQVIDNKMFVTKRNGEVVDFNPEKIKIAIGKCIRAAKKEINQEGLNQIVDSIVEEIQTRFIDFYPNVENVQDIVEKHLIDNDLYEIAKGYILYRAKRREDREKQQEITIEKANIDAAADWEGIRAFTVSGSDISDHYPAYSYTTGDLATDEAVFFVKSTNGVHAGTDIGIAYHKQPTDITRGDFEQSSFIT